MPHRRTNSAEVRGMNCSLASEHGPLGILTAIENAEDRVCYLHHGEATALSIFLLPVRSGFNLV